MRGFRRLKRLVRRCSGWSALVQQFGERHHGSHAGHKDLGIDLLPVLRGDPRRVRFENLIHKASSPAARNAR